MTPVGNIPSKEYKKHLQHYKDMHKKGLLFKSGKILTPENTYCGLFTSTYAKIVKNMISKNGYQSLLEYGSGKGTFYRKKFNIDSENFKTLKEYWDVKIELYDPAFKEHSVFPNPNNKIDITICIDVLEHIPEQDIDWILRRIFKKTKKFIFIVIGSYSAQALLPNGENAHILIKEPKWWFEKFLEFKKKFIGIKIICLCITKDKNEKAVYNPINIDDVFKKYL